MSRFSAIGAIVVRVVIAVVIAAVLFLLGSYWDRSHSLSSGFSQYDRLLALLAIAAGVIAVAYEYALESSFKRIFESVSTRFLGLWPDHLEEIATLVGAVNDEFIISVDTFGYAHFSNHKGFLAYLDELEGAAKRGASIKILLPPSHMCKKSLEEQFAKEKEKGNEKLLAQLLRNYHEMYKGQLGPDLKDFEDFLDCDLFVEGWYCKRLEDNTVMVDKNCKVEVAIRSDQTSHESVYYWIARRNKTPKEAIFAYPRFIGPGKGYAFRTQDTKLMDIFSSDFDVKWETATKKPSGCILYPDEFTKIEDRKAKGKAGGVES